MSNGTQSLRKFGMWKKIIFDMKFGYQTVLTDAVLHIKTMQIKLKIIITEKKRDKIPSK